MEDQVVIREVGLRDGLQMVSKILSAERKIEWCRQSYELGIQEIEVTSFVPPKLVPQFADAEQVVNEALDIDGLKVAALVPNLFGARKAIAAGVDKVQYTMSCSETHNMKNVRRTIAESIDDFQQVQEYKKTKAAESQSKIGCGLSMAFGCNMEGTISQSQVLKIVNEILKIGVDELIIADTVGMANPRQVSKLLKAILNEAGDVPVAVHFHDTRGLGLVNSLAAFDVGIREFDASLAGLGGCPFAPNATGNITTEDLTFMFESIGVDTGIDLRDLIELRKKVVSWLPDEKFSGYIAEAGLPINYD